MRTPAFSLTALLLLPLAACMPTVRSSFRENALQRATFDLDCTRDAMQLIALNVDLDDPARVGSQVGVEGCGKRAVYVLTSSGWILNSAQDMK